MTVRFAFVGLAIIVAAAVVGNEVTADEIVDDVMARPRPDYDAKGMPLGAWRLFPSLTLGVSSDDNVFRQDTSTDSDMFFKIRPGMLLKSEWTRHQLNLHAWSDSELYLKFHDESVTDWSVGGDGRLDVLRELRIEGDLDFSQLHELRESPDLPGFAKEPTPYKQTRADISATWQPSRIGFSAGIGFDRFDFDSVGINGGGTLNNDDRDRDVYIPFAKVFYELSPGRSMFVNFAYNTRDFDKQLDRSGLDRSSNGYRVSGGVDLMLGHLVRGEAYVGYLDQQYHAPLPDISGIDFGVSLDWYVTLLTTVRLGASRTINDTTIAFAAATDDREVHLTVDHELLRNVILHATVGYLDSEFKGTPRDDRVASAGLGADYLLNRYLSLSANYVYQQRDSNIAGQDFNDNRFFLGLTAHP